MYRALAIASVVLGCCCGAGARALQSNTAAGAEAPAAVHIARDSVAASQVVALGRDLVLEGRAAAGVAVLNGSARIAGTVDGDVVVLGGRAELESTASIDGDVFVLGGDIHAQPGSRVTGRSVAYPTAPGALLVLAEGPALGLSPWSRVVVGTKLALLAAWLVTVMALVGAAWPAIESTATAIAEAPLRSFSAGLVAVLAMLLLGLFLSAFLGVAAACRCWCCSGSRRSSSNCGERSRSARCSGAVSRASPDGAAGRWRSRSTVSRSSARSSSCPG